MNTPARVLYGPDEIDMLSRIEAVLQHGFGWLKFPLALEQRFQADTRAARIRHHTIFGLLGTLLFDSFLLGDRMMVPDVLEFSAWIRLGLVTPIALFGIWALRLGNAFLREAIVSLTVTIMGAALVLIMLRTHSPNVTHYYIGIPVILLFATTVQRVRFWHALACTVVLFAIVAAGMTHVAAISAEVRQTFLLILGATASMTLAALYSLERE